LLAIRQSAAIFLHTTMRSQLLLAFLLPAFSLACSSGDDDSTGTGGSSGTMSASGGSTSGSGGTTGGTGGSAAGAGGSAAGAGGSAAGAGGSAAGAGGSAAGAGGSAGGGQCASGTLKLAAANNYTFSSNITLTPTKIKANEPNLTFDWSGLTTDFLGRTIDPKTDIDSVLLVVLSLTVDQFQQHVNDDDGMLKTFNQGALQLVTNKALSSANLQDFGVPGQSQNTYKTSIDVQNAVNDYLNPDKFDPTKNTLALMPSQGTNVAGGYRMIQLFTVDAGATATSIALTGDTRVAAGTGGHTGGTMGSSMSVTYDTHLQSLIPIKIAAGDTSFMVDWSGLSKNALNRDWIKSSISKLVIGHYTQSLTELENQFFDLETISTNIYSEYVPDDTPISVSGLKEETTSAAFPGIDNTGTWIMALFCDPSFCGNPAPWFLTILQTCN
jgi:hypothetical protein